MTWYNCCCKSGYTTRCYDHDGNTIWTADYWDGASNGSAESYLTSGIAVDSEGNVYVSGPCALDSESSATWSLVSYDSSGEVRWKKDIRTPVRAFGGLYSTWNGSMWDVVCTDDDRIVVLGSQTLASGTLKYTVFCYHPDGTTATIPSFVGYSDPRVGPRKLLTANNVLRIRGVYDGFGSFASQAACRVGTSNSYLTDAGGGSAGDFGNPNAARLTNFADDLSAIGVSFLPWKVLLKPSSGSPSAAYLSTLVTSFDGTEFYGSGQNLYADIFGSSAVKYSTMRFIPSNTSGVGVNAIWGVQGPLRSVSAYTDQAIAVGGGGTPHLQSLRDSDGCTLWAHNHQNLYGMVSTATRLFTTGDRQTTSADQSFVDVDDACLPCDGDCLYTGTTDSPTETTYNSNATVTFTGYGRVSIEVWGGGGGGGGDVTGNSARQGGGAGENRSLSTTFTPSTTLTLTIGAAGVNGGVSVDSGGNGGNTTVSGTYSITANGGKGGQGATGSNTGAAGSGGSGGTGSTGGNGASPAGANGGSGGNAVGGGTGGAGGGGGISGNAPGGGGAGCDNQFGGENGIGGNGAKGRVKITVQPAEWEFTGDDCTGGGCSPCRSVDSTFYEDYGFPTSSGDEITIPCE